jgi:hypothetical protein
MYYQNECNKKQIDKISLTTILYFIPIYIYLIKSQHILCMLGICCTCFSYLYHITYEQVKLYLYFDMFFSIITMIHLHISMIPYYLTNIYFVLYFYILNFIAISFYLKGCGRNKSFLRNSDYNKYHLYWHLCIFIISLSHSIFI